MGNLFIISAPSGTGKTTLINSLLLEIKNLTLSVSVTTRKPRENELNGVDYFFVSKKEFNEKIKNNELLEYATIFDEKYGTLRENVDKALMSDNDLILEIDYQGAKEIKKIYNNSIMVFILPPSIEALENRLKLRNKDTKLSIEKRLKNAHTEIVNSYNYDFIIINNKLQDALFYLKTIIYAFRCSCKSKHKDIFKILDKLKIN